MSEKAWRDRIAGERMTVDEEFNDRIRSSSFSNQQWGLIMTATEMEIENPEDPENARLVANTDKLPRIMSEVENMENQMGGMGAGESSAGGGIISRLAGVLGLGGGGSGGGSSANLAEAEELVQEYAEELQSQLEANGRWEQVCKVAAEN